MPKPRNKQIALSETPFYHLTYRCVRRSFLCGELDGFNFEHRREWIVERLRLLTTMFAIDVASYAIMMNHYHVLVRVNVEKAASLTASEIFKHWSILFQVPDLMKLYLAGHLIEDDDIQAAENMIEIYRERLTSISWFMRCLNEHIARLANVEDKCSGRFWEGRFKSQAILDEAALINTMVYIDLNPIRAKIAETPESSAYTSIAERIGERILATDVRCSFHGKLMPFGDGKGIQGAPQIPMHLTDYIELVDWTGRQIRPDKHGAISENVPPILARLGIEQGNWLQNCQKLEEDFRQVIGPVAAIDKFCKAVGQKWLQGIHSCRRCFG
ncbi:MAG: transposase [Rheinheimera sp.]|nr:transposase [Rheinheimera sp.]